MREEVVVVERRERKMEGDVEVRKRDKRGRSEGIPRL